MAHQPKRTVDPRVEAARPYLEGVAKKLADDLFGSQGPLWGTRLTELEDIALDARTILSEKLLALSLDRQAATSRETRPADLQPCPTCQQPFDESQERDARCVETRAGDVGWDEPREYCTHCRRAFFAAEPRSTGFQ